MLNSDLIDLIDDIAATTSVQFSVQGQNGFKSHDLGSTSKSGYLLVSATIIRSDSGVASNDYPALVEIFGSRQYPQIYLHTYGNAIFNGTILLAWKKA